MKREQTTRRRQLAAVMLAALALTSVISNAADEVKDKAPELSKPQPHPQRKTNPFIGSRDEATVPMLLSGAWNGPRLADGQPDVQGLWYNTIGFHFNLTDPQGAQDQGRPYNLKGIPGVWRSGQYRPDELGPRDQRAPSRVSDPADGKVPFQPWAAEKVDDFQAHYNNPIEPKYIDTQARCAPAGPVKSIYWHTFELLQYPGYVVLVFDSGSRIIYLSGKPNLPDRIKLWNGDSHGHWEGNTLVVDVANQNGKPTLAATGEFISENGKVQERFIFDNDRQRFNYQAVLSDPTVYTRPFTITVPLRREPTDKVGGRLHLQKQSDGVSVLESEAHHCVEFNEGYAGGASEDAGAKL